MPGTRGKAGGTAKKKMAAKRHKKTFGNDINVWYLAFDGNGGTICLCQNSINCTL